LAALDSGKIGKMADSDDSASQKQLDRLATNDDRPATDGQPVRGIDQALLGGAPQRVGRFEYRYDTDTWTWSDTVARIHGYQPGEVEPTTELVLSHKHPDDLARVKGLLQQSAAPFSSRHRIRTTTGETRKVVVVGDPVTDADGQVVASRGFYIDITESFNADLQETISDKVQAIVSHREIIDQAKGMLMAIYQLDADAAFELLNANSATRRPIDHYLLTLTPPGTR
jgi:PAS domain S-box-containing protein